MPLSVFHPAVSRWFAETLGDPTPPQRRGWPFIKARRHTLIAAPTGSGKTLAGFLCAINELFEEGLRAPLADEVRVVYVSPLKALSADVHKNLAEPRLGICRVAQTMGIEAPTITAAVRTGDTPQAERAAMLRRPPHILVTTPESLYLLLTAERSRQMLRTVRTVIVDEIHSVIESRRGAHLALSLERLQRITHGPIVRLGLSATQKPIEEIARFLVGTKFCDDSGQADCAIVDEGHWRPMDLGVELPASPLEAVMPNEIWQEYYDRLTELIRGHRTTLVFVNTRRMAERVARHLSERCAEGEHDIITAHHGSLSKDKRLDAEERLKSGRLRALVATASLELGIDIGHVDLVCQIGSPRRISTWLQRAGRSGHSVSGTPKARLFPVSRDDLVECAALMKCSKEGLLDRLIPIDAPLDVLAQQIVAEAASEDRSEDDLFELALAAHPYRHLSREDFDRVIGMLAQGFATRRGRRSALLHHDEVNRRVRGRRASRLQAISSGGAIPDNADYRVVIDVDETFVGTLNEDFAIESQAGDVFQLGNTSWRILRVGAGVVRVQDAKGEPPNIPFWLGEAPARSDELSAAVSDLRRESEMRLGPESTASNLESTLDWLATSCGITPTAAQEIGMYFSDSLRTLGVLPSQDTIVLERFFDESGGMQLVLHAPFGSRVNRAWGLALRKRFCRQFNFELQAAATDDGLLLSLGPQHSFPLADVFRYLHPNTVRDVLVQALLDAPMFETRWRWNATISLAVARNRGGKKIPPPLQRMQADDLLAAVFPDAAACLENIPGDREVPDHPLVGQTIRDCLTEGMDLARLEGILGRIHRGEIRTVARDTPEPSPLCHEILNARPYAFLDDAPLEERRAHALYARRATEPNSAGELGALDRMAIARVRSEAWPDPRDADELHDSLLTGGWLTEREGTTRGDGRWLAWFEALARQGRAARVISSRERGLSGSPVIWIACERLNEAHAIWPDAEVAPPLVPPQRRQDLWTRATAIRELLRSRVAIIGATTVSALANTFAVDPIEIDAALHELEAEGLVLRGHFTAGETELEWCERSLLARMHRYTLNRLRAEIEPVSPADFMRFLFAWQRISREHQVVGSDGLRQIVAMLDGYELPAAAWERHVLPARVSGFEPSFLDLLSLTGQVGWARLSQIARSSAEAEGPVTSGNDAPIRPVRSTPIALFQRAHLGAWQALRGERAELVLSEPAQRVTHALDLGGALFLHEVASKTDLSIEQLEHALGELVAAGLVTADGFAGLRRMITARDLQRQFDRHTKLALEAAGRWSLIQPRPWPLADAVELQAKVLLGRYGVVCRRLLAREPNLAPWRELVSVFRRLEARGEIRGGRFVNGMSGEQFALPQAIPQLREIRRTPANQELVAISGCDPLNLAGIVTAGERVAAVRSHRIVYCAGMPIAAMEGDYIRQLAEYDPSLTAHVAEALAQRKVPAVASGYVGRGR